jgi:hypothetical protein
VPLQERSKPLWLLFVYACSQDEGLALKCATLSLYQMVERNPTRLITRRTQIGEHPGTQQSQVVVVT